MSDAGGAAGGGTTGATGAVEGGAGAATGAAGGAANPAGGAASGGVGAGATDWTAGLPELSRGYIQNKGWKGPGDIVESYQSLEKNFGVPPNQLVKLPKDETDAEGWGKVWGQLGRPEKPEGYGFKDKDGKTSDFQKWASETFHGAGLTAKQAQGVVAKWDAHVTEMTKAQETAYNQKIETEVGGLKAEWGLAHDQNIKQAKIAAGSLGVDEKAVESLEKVLGYSATMKLFQKIGSKIGEGDFVAGDRSDSFGRAMTPEAARSKIEELKQDVEWRTKFIAGGASEKHELDRLHKFAYPEYSS